MFSEKLKELRKSKNITQEELADKIFVSRSAIAKWESNKGIPSEENLKYLCNFFEVESSYFLGVDDYKKELERVNVGYRKGKYALISIAVTLIIFVFSLIPIFNYRFEGSYILSSLYKPSLSIMNVLGYYSYILCCIYVMLIIYSIIYTTNILSIKESVQDKVLLIFNITSFIIFVSSFVASIVIADKNNYGLFWKG